MPQREYDRRNSLIFFENDRQRTGKNPKTGQSFNDPEFQGTLTDESGDEWWLSIWPKEGEKGLFYTGSIKRKEEQGQRPNPQRSAPSMRSGGLRRSAPAQDDDDIP